MLFFFLFLSYVCSTSGNNDFEIKYLIDGNIIEMDSLYIITNISWTKSSTNNYNYLFGIFEGSTDITFSDSFPIAMIKEENVINDDTNYINIRISAPYKYLRYIPPNIENSKITPVKIFGHIFSDSEDLSIKQFFKPTNLPLMIINTENSIEPISKEEYIDSRIILVNDDKIELNEKASIKVRGHSTATRPKKPFKIKFEKKQKVLNFSGKFKKWTLLANHYDSSLIRNILAFQISTIIGLEFTPRCEPVDIILNNNYRGNYFICDQIEVKSGRVEIEEMTKIDINEPNITGGYLLEIDQRAKKEEKYFLTNKGIVGEIKYPDSDDITKEQEKYINQYLNKVEEKVYNNNFSYLDLDSFYKYFIMQEFCGDIDFVVSSFHCTKRRNDDKLYFGPVWDYDLSFDNDDRLIPTNQKPKFVLYYGDSSGTTKNFIIHIIKNKEIMSNINKTWFELQEEGLDFETLNSFIDKKIEFLLIKEYDFGGKNTNMSRFLFFVFIELLL